MVYVHGSCLNKSNNVSVVVQEILILMDPSKNKVKWPTLMLYSSMNESVIVQKMIAMRIECGYIPSYV
jgi:hypothetical protein